MSSTIQIVLETGVIACTKKQKQTVIGLGLKGRHSVTTVKDTPANRGMLNKISHLARIVEKAPERNPWASFPAEYELGTVKLKVESEKKVKKAKPTSEGGEASKTKVKASAKGEKSKAPAVAKKSKSSPKKVKGK